MTTPIFHTLLFDSLPATVGYMILLKAMIVFFCGSFLVTLRILLEQEEIIKWYENHFTGMFRGTHPPKRTRLYRYFILLITIALSLFVKKRRTYENN